MKIERPRAGKSSGKNQKIRAGGGWNDEIFEKIGCQSSNKFVSTLMVCFFKN